MSCQQVFGNISGEFRSISRFGGNFGGFRGNTWISRVHDRTKYQKPCYLNLDICQNQRSYMCMHVYSYFKKGCQKKCTQQSRKVLWVVLSSLFFKYIYKNGMRSHGIVFAIAKGKLKKWVWQLQGQEKCINHIPYYLLGLSHAHFFQQPFSK